MSLFSTPKAPQPDPAVVAQQKRAQQQADDDLTAQIQQDLRQRTRARLQQYGLVTPTAGGGFAPNLFLMSPRSPFASSGGVPSGS